MEFLDFRWDIIWNYRELFHTWYLGNVNLNTLWIYRWIHIRSFTRIREKFEKEMALLAL